MDYITGYVLKYMISGAYNQKNGNAPLSTIKRELLVSNRYNFSHTELLETFTFQIYSKVSILPLLLMNMAPLAG